MNREVEITALALGELDEEAARALEETLTDAEREEVEEIRSLAGLLSTAPRPADGLDMKRHAAIDAALSRPADATRNAHRAKRRRPLRWVFGAASVAAAVCAFGLFLTVGTMYDASYAPPASQPPPDYGAIPAMELPPEQRAARKRALAELRARAKSSGKPARDEALARRLGSSPNTVPRLDWNQQGSRPYHDPRALMKSSVQEPTPDAAPDYDAVIERDFISVKDRPVTTLAVDVDTAAYANVRRHLMRGERPPRDAVRVEEMINYFTYDLPAPTDGHPLAIVADVTDAPWNPNHLVARVALSSKASQPVKRARANLVFLVDVSCSMSEPNKLALMKSSLARTVRGLNEDDQVAIVSYASSAKTLLASTPAANLYMIDHAIRRLVPGGQTNGAEGLRTAYAVAAEHHIQGGINRVIVATDGGFNAGPTDRDALVRLIQNQRAKNTFLTVLGLGDDLKDGLLEYLADRDDGHYHVIDSAEEANRVLSQLVGGTLAVVAKDTKVQLELNPRRVAKYRLIGYENRRLANTDFSNDSVDGGEIGAGHAVTMLYELIPAPGNDDDQLLYQDTTSPDGVDKRNDLFRVRVRYKPPQGDTSRKIERSVHAWKGHHLGAPHDLRFATAVAAFGMRLADSPHQGRISYDVIAKLARGALGEDQDGRRKEFIQLVERAARLER
ncbi:MAG: von Willebrand factor type A domain-containing protein [Deltaproteobacteria bacterium]